MKPLFIVIEGPDGSGKTTQAKLVARAIGAVYESEPTDSPPGKLVRAFLRGQERVEDVRARQLIFAADRLEHTRRIRALLDDGRSVVGDRYVASSMSYGAADMATATNQDVQATMEMAVWTSRINTFALVPDVTVVLDVNFDRCADRIHARTAQDIYEGGRFQRLVHALYERAANLLPGHLVVHVDANGSEADVTAAILAVVHATHVPPRALSESKVHFLVCAAVIEALSVIA